MKKKARVIAFYLPQYHPIPENDNWWGKGFTEWTNTAKAKPMFKGHYQPHVPADLGFYDLRVPETRVAQAEMARESGIDAFCYYHYWFAGRRILERPFREVLQSGKPAFPFCICWANESWTGIWHGSPDKSLIKQTYPGAQDHEQHFATLLPAFTDPRYLTVDDKPLFIIYRPWEIPEIENVTDQWRKMAKLAGLPGLHLVGVHATNLSWIPQQHGFDASIEVRLPLKSPYISLKRPVKRLVRYCRQTLGRPTMYQFDAVVDSLVAKAPDGLESYPCPIPNWDNTPRSGRNGLVLRGSTPELFRRQLKKAIDLIQPYPSEHQLIFIKSWNEWAEGNHLEPDLRFGRAYLNVIKEELPLSAAVSELQMVDVF
jgi:hypothetical protein